MAKEQWHRWGQTVATIITLAFVCGITYSRIEINTSDIEEVEGDLKIVKTDVHNIQINQAEKIATDKAIAASLLELKTGMKSIQDSQIVISGDLRETKVKVETLIKD